MGRANASINAVHRRPAGKRSAVTRVGEREREWGGGQGFAEGDTTAWCCDDRRSGMRPPYHSKSCRKTPFRHLLSPRYSERAPRPESSSLGSWGERLAAGRLAWEEDRWASAAGQRRAWAAVQRPAWADFRQLQDRSAQRMTSNTFRGGVRLQRTYGCPAGGAWETPCPHRPRQNDTFDAPNVSGGLSGRECLQVSTVCMGMMMMMMVQRGDIWDPS